MLELDELRMLEPDYASLVNNGEPGVLICEAEPADKGARLLIDEDESPLLFAVKSGDEWCGTSWLFRSPTAGEFSLFEAADGDIYQEDRGNVEDACRAYYAEIIQTVIAPAGDDLTEERVGKVRGLLHEVWGPSISGTALDACAGSGIGSLLLREMGADPIAYDNDPELLALGLSSGRLAPGRTACIDARAASAYLPDAEYGSGSCSARSTDIQRISGGRSWRSLPGSRRRRLLPWQLRRKPSGCRSGPTEWTGRFRSWKIRVIRSTTAGSVSGEGRPLSRMDPSPVLFCRLFCAFLLQTRGWRACRTSDACPLTFTLSHAARILPVESITNVLRKTPMYSRP